MKELTIEAIRENPWNVLTHELSRFHTEPLLRAACLAADYCCQSEHLLMQAAREGTYTPKGWTPGPETPDAHEFHEDRWLKALEMFEELRALHAYEYPCELQSPDDEE